LLRAFLDRLAPRRRERGIEFDVAKIVTASDARAASTALLAACARGDISLEEAAQFMALLDKSCETGGNRGPRTEGGYVRKGAQDVNKRCIFFPENIYCACLNLSSLVAGREIEAMACTQNKE